LDRRVGGPQSLSGSISEEKNLIITPAGTRTSVLVSILNELFPVFGRIMLKWIILSMGPVLGSRNKPEMSLKEIKLTIEQRSSVATIIKYTKIEGQRRRP
jgi:hypothetical protein